MAADFSLRGLALSWRGLALSLGVLALSLWATTRNPVVVWHWIPDQVRDDSCGVRDGNCGVRDGS